MDFAKDHEELYNKTSEHFKDKTRKECLWKQFANSRRWSVNVCKTWIDSQRTCYRKLTQSKSGQALKEMMEHQTCILDKLGFLRLHIRCKGLSKLSAFKFQARGVSASAIAAHDISRASTDTDSMDISMQSTDSMLQPQQVRSPTAASGRSLVDQQVMDQPSIGPSQDHCCKPFNGPSQDHPNLSKFISCGFFLKKTKQTRSLTPPHTKHFCPKNKKSE